MRLINGDWDCDTVKDSAEIGAGVVGECVGEVDTP